MVFETKAKNSVAKKEIDSVPYISVLGILLEKLLCVLCFYGKVLLILTTSPIAAGKNQ